MITRKNFLKMMSGASGFALAASAPVFVGTPSARAVPVIGRAGLVGNANNLTDYITLTYPGVLSIGGVRNDPLPDHPSGHAIDIMVGGNTALGNMIHSDIKSQAGRFGIKYTLWQVPAHYDHIHVTVF